MVFTGLQQNNIRKTKIYFICLPAFTHFPCHSVKCLSPVASSFIFYLLFTLPWWQIFLKFYIVIASVHHLKECFYEKSKSLQIYHAYFYYAGLNAFRHFRTDIRSGKPASPFYYWYFYFFRCNYFWCSYHPLSYLPPAVTFKRYYAGWFLSILWGKAESRPLTKASYSVW